MLKKIVKNLKKSRGYVLILVAVALPIFFAGVTYLIKSGKISHNESIKTAAAGAVGTAVLNAYQPGVSWNSQSNLVYSAGAQVLNDKAYSIFHKMMLKTENSAVKKISNKLNYKDLARVHADIYHGGSVYKNYSSCDVATYPITDVITSLDNGSASYYSYKVDDKGTDFRLNYKKDSSKLSIDFSTTTKNAICCNCKCIDRTVTIYPTTCDIDLILTIPTNHAACTIDNSNSGTLIAPNDTKNAKSTPIQIIATAYENFLKKHFLHTGGVAVGIIPYSGKLTLPPGKDNWTVQIPNYGIDDSKEPRLMQAEVYASKGGFGEKIAVTDTKENYTWNTRCIMSRLGTNNMGKGVDLLSTDNPNTNAKKFRRMNVRSCYLGYCNLLANACEKDCVQYHPNLFFLQELTDDVLGIAYDMTLFRPMNDPYNKSNFLFLPIHWACNLLSDWTAHPGGTVSGKMSHAARKNKKKVVILVVNAPNNFEPKELTYLGFNNDAAELPMSETDAIVFSSPIQVDGKIQGTKGILIYEGAGNYDSGNKEFTCTGTGKLKFPRKGLVKLVVKPAEPASWKEVNVNVNATGYNMGRLGKNNSNNPIYVCIDGNCYDLALEKKSDGEPSQWKASKNNTLTNKLRSFATSGFYTGIVNCGSNKYVAISRDSGAVAFDSSSNSPTTCATVKVGEKKTTTGHGGSGQYVIPASSNTTITPISTSIANEKSVLAANNIIMAHSGDSNYTVISADKGNTWSVAGTLTYSQPVGNSWYIAGIPCYSSTISSDTSHLNTCSRVLGYGEGRWITGQYTIYYSTNNGTAWTECDHSLGNIYHPNTADYTTGNCEWYGAEYTNGYFHVVNYSTGQVARSPNGSNWKTVQSLPSTAGCRNIQMYDGNLWCFNESGSKAYYINPENLSKKEVTPTIKFPNLTKNVTLCAQKNSSYTISEQQTFYIDLSQISNSKDGAFYYITLDMNSISLVSAEITNRKYTMYESKVTLSGNTVTSTYHPESFKIKVRPMGVSTITISDSAVGNNGTRNINVGATSNLFFNYFDGYASNWIADSDNLEGKSAPKKKLSYSCYNAKVTKYSISDRMIRWNGGSNSGFCDQGLTVSNLGASTTANTTKLTQFIRWDNSIHTKYTHYSNPVYINWNWGENLTGTISVRFESDGYSAGCMYNAYSKIKFGGSSKQYKNQTSTTICSLTDKANSCEFVNAGSCAYYDDFWVYWMVFGVSGTATYSNLNSTSGNISFIGAGKVNLAVQSTLAPKMKLNEAGNEYSINGETEISIPADKFRKNTTPEADGHYNYTLSFSLTDAEIISNSLAQTSSHVGIWHHKITTPTNCAYVDYSQKSNNKPYISNGNLVSIMNTPGITWDNNKGYWIATGTNSGNNDIIRNTTNLPIECDGFWIIDDPAVHKYSGNMISECYIGGLFRWFADSSVFTNNYFWCNIYSVDTNPPSFLYGGYVLPVNYALLNGNYHKDKDGMLITSTDALNNIATAACTKLKTMADKVYLIKYKTDTTALDTCVKGTAYKADNASQLETALNQIAAEIKSIAKYNDPKIVVETTTPNTITVETTK